MSGAVGIPVLQGGEDVKILALVGVQAPADARPAAKPLVPGLPVYFALGDSVTAGQDSAPDPLDWRANGYAGQVFDAMVDDLDGLPAASVEAADGCRQLQYLNIARPALPGSAGRDVDGSGR